MSNAVTHNHVFTGAQQRGNKWLCKFDTLRLKEGEEAYVCFSAESPAVWDTIEQALDAGTRAATQCNETGAFPNMCERW